MNTDLGAMTDRDILIRLATQMENVQAAMRRADDRLGEVERRLSAVEVKTEKGESWFGGAKAVFAFLGGLPLGALAFLFGMDHK